MPLGVPTSYRPKYSSSSGGGQFGVPSPTQMAGLGQLNPYGAGSAVGNAARPLFTPPQANSQSLIDQYNAAVAFYQQQNAPQMAEIINARNALQGRLSNVQAQYGQQAGFLRDQFDLAMRGIGNDQAAAQVDRNAVGRQQGYYDQLLGLLTGQRDQGLAFNQQIGGLLNQMFETQGKQFDLKEQTTKRGSERAKAQAMSDAIARGAVVTPGAVSDQEFLQAELTDALSGIGMERTGAKLQFEQEKAGLDNRTKQILSEFKQGELSNREQRAQLDDRLKQLDIQAQQVGLKKEELALQLKQGLANLNIDKQMSVSQLMDMLNSNDARQQALANQVMQAAYTTQGMVGGYSNGVRTSWGPGSGPTSAQKSQPNKGTRTASRR